MRPQAEQWFEQCSKKAKYYSLAVAELVVSRAKTERGIDLRIYKCDFCRNFHVTKKPARPGTYNNLSGSLLTSET